MVACASAHHWARQLGKFGHNVRLRPAVYVTPYVKWQKNDATNAEAICEAVTHPKMRFLPVRSEEQRAVIMMHRVREQLVRQRSMIVNAIRGHACELCLVSRQGIVAMMQLVSVIECEGNESIPTAARTALLALVRQMKTELPPVS